MADLTAIARAPPLARPWPDLPAVPLERLIADLDRTTESVLDLELCWDPSPDGGLWMCDLTLDGLSVGGCGIVADVDDDEAAPVALAASVCESWLHERVADVPPPSIPADVARTEERRGGRLELRSGSPGRGPHWSARTVDRRRPHP